MGDAGLRPEAWDSFATAEVGAAAALAGLLVVACSINIARIIKMPSIVSRLAGTLVSFSLVLTVASLLLVPGQSHAALGIEIAAAGALAALVVLRRNVLRGLDPQYRPNAIVMVGLNALACALMAVSGVLLALDVAGALFWLVPATVLAFTVGLGNAWVALVEILR